jgi:hypothetical protein
MPVQYQRMRCGDCGRELDEPASTPVPGRRPCPQCGSMVRLAEVGIGSTLTLRSMLAFKARHAGPGRPFAEGKVGDDLHRKSGHWFRLERIIDRALIFGTMRLDTAVQDTEHWAEGEMGQRARQSAQSTSRWRSRRASTQKCDRPLAPSYLMR